MENTPHNQTIITPLAFRDIVEDILKTIEREREREIIARRFGLYQPKQTLEQIGDLLGITRERVRQIEKAVLKRMSTEELPHQTTVNEQFVAKLTEMGNSAKMEDFAIEFNAESHEDYAHIHFLSTVAPDIEVLSENDNYHHAVGLREQHNEAELKTLIDRLCDIVKEIGEPTKVSVIATKLNEIGDFDDLHVKSLLSLSKHISHLDGNWGLNKWPTVNPKNIRDKIYVVLQRAGKPLHFNDISRAIKNSDFKRRDVTTQAIHNELIKDKRFVLIGRGIYALREWGFSSGTVADVISSILNEESPLHRDEIVSRVLKQRHVKETTILLNLQGKPQFERVAKATYALAD